MTAQTADRLGMFAVEQLVQHLRGFAGVVSLLHEKSVQLVIDRKAALYGQRQLAGQGPKVGQGQTGSQDRAMPAGGHFPQLAAAVDAAGEVVVVGAKRAHGLVRFRTFVVVRPAETVSGNSCRSRARKALDEFCDPLSMFPDGRRNSRRQFRIDTRPPFRRPSVPNVMTAPARSLRG